MSIVSQLKALKSNLFGGKGNTGHTQPPSSRVQQFRLDESPTGVIANDPFKFSTLSYPMDVQNNFQNGHYMLFYVNKQNKSNFTYSTTSDGVTQISDVSGDNKGLNLSEARYKKLRKIKVGTGSRTGNYASTNSTRYNPHTDDGTSLTSEKQNDNLGVSSLFEATTRITDSVAMYLPANVEDTTAATYSDAATGIAGFALATGLNTGKDAASIARSLVAGSEVLLKDMGIKAIAAVAEVAGAEGVAGLAKKAFGEADNPYMEVLFDAMSLRTFTYNFKFAPRNETEALEAQKIIQLFRFHMAPELRPGVNRFLGIPSTFDIHYMFLSKNGMASENSFYNRIATCVLTDCKVNYTPEGVKSFEDGGPTQTTMTLTFKEKELLTKDKIAEGY